MRSTSLSVRGRRAWHRVAGAAVLILGSGASGLPAQTAAPVALRAHAEASPSPVAIAVSVRGQTLQPPAVAPWWAPIASAALPGTGQFALKQQRSVAYLVAEGFLVVQYLAARRDGNRERDAYRTLAVDVARRPFGGTRPGEWEYYERLEQFLESGAYDRVPGGALDPETDAATYNGFRWRLARETFWRDPDTPPEPTSTEYQRAIGFYQQTAVSDEFRWSWRDAQLEQDLYVQTIRSANRSYQRAVNLLGVVAVNHLASLVDAYVSVRVRRFGGAGIAGVSLQHVAPTYTPTPDGRGGQWGLSARLAVAP